VEFAAAEQAQAAIERLHNTQLNGRPIFVREDRESGAGALLLSFPFPSLPF
jgi:RNA recognition motif-containing protein